jgi:site-specific DNA-cytosine methylase
LPATFGIVDLFAGPGGLGEGFASLEIGGHAPFRIGISVEKEASAHRTLTLRAFLRSHQARHGTLPHAFIDFHAGLIPEPDWSEVDAAAWQHATAEAQCLELGTEPAAAAIDHAIGALRRDFDDTILIGGPPCQAYSLVGRARAKGKVGYVPEEDERHYLFREYIRVLDRLRPAAFVMENVKGMLSSTVESRLVFEMLMEDLASLGTGQGHHYEIRAIRVSDGRASLQEAAQPSDFIVRAEEWGVPQRRHRVIIVGIRSDLADRATGTSVPISGVTRTVDDAIGMMPELRSGLSRGRDDPASWRREVVEAARLLAGIHRGQGRRAAARRLLRRSEGPEEWTVGAPPVSTAPRGLRYVERQTPRLAGAPCLARFRPTRDTRAHALGPRPLSVHCRLRRGARLQPKGFRFPAVAQPRPSQLAQRRFQRPLPGPGRRGAIDHGHEPHLEGRPLLHPPRSNAVPQPHRARGGAPPDLPG